LLLTLYELRFNFLSDQEALLLELINFLFLKER